MKYLFSIVLAIYLISGGLFPRTGASLIEYGNPGGFSGMFVLVEDNPLRVSIDTGWERNGNIPVFLVFSDLEIRLGVNTDILSRAIDTETCINEILVEDMNLTFVTYEKNPLRTRMELIDKSNPVKLKINGEKEKAEFYVGDSRLKLEPIRVKFTRIVPSEMYELTLMGADVRVRYGRKFIFVPSSNIIYTASHNNGTTDISLYPGKNKDWNVWAIGITPERENSLTGVNEREN